MNPAFLDPDGLAIPALWQGNPGKWASMPLSWRERHSAMHLAEMAKAPKKEREQRPFASRFTTDYAIKWGRAQGWKLIDRERYDYRTKRHHDLEGGTDAMFDDLTVGRVGIQGAGRGERAAHYQRFLDWGGPEKAKRRNLRVVYLEFERNNLDPILTEWWA